MFNGMHSPLGVGGGQAKIKNRPFDTTPHTFKNASIPCYVLRRPSPATAATVFAALIGIATNFFCI